MNASRAALLVVGVNLVAVWAAAAAGGRAAVAEPSATPQLVAEQAVEEASSSLVAAAARLEAHARRATPPALGRDPFRFGADARPAAHHVSGPPRHQEAPVPPETTGSPVEAEPDIALQGMAESGDGDGLVRTAILRSGGDLVLASLGTRVGARYEVVGLTSDSVELEDLVAHVRRTWRMK